MATFKEANQVRVELKMRLSNHSWYKSSSIITDNDGYSVLIEVKEINNSVRKAIPPVINNIEIKTEAD
jgi:hypothetical protein